MHLLLIGQGGREHALAWKLARSERITRISVAPGNPGIAQEPKCHMLELDPGDIDALLDFARREAVHLTVIGPEAPLVDGIVDRFRAAGQRIFGPRRDAARLEGSKGFAKDFMQRHGIPTAAFRRFDDQTEALAYLEQRGAPIVIKADGLAAGKGVVVAQTVDEARSAVTSMLGDQRFGEAGRRIVIEDFLGGEEASFIAIVSGRQCLPLASSQDHKARDEGDQGPNTGGMGAYSPAPVVTSAVHRHVVEDIVQPTIDALADEGMPFVGFLYVGLMIDDTGQARVVEFNVRLGDPETQPLMLRLESDLLTLLDAAVDGTLDEQSAEWFDGAAIGVVLAAEEYPAGSSRDAAISGLDTADPEDCKVFHAGTRRAASGQIVTAGGRVLCVTARATELQQAKAVAEQRAGEIRWSGSRYRRDIGYRALSRRRPT